MYVCMTRRENAFPSFPARASDFHVPRFTLHVTKSIVPCKVKKHELRAKQRLKRSRNTTPVLSLHASGGIFNNACLHFGESKGHMRDGS